MTENRWTALEQHQPHSLLDLFASDPDRVRKMTMEQSGLRFDLSKTHLDDAALGHFVKLAADMQLDTAKAALFSGAAINVTEGRAAEHSAERGTGDADSVAYAHALQQRMRGLVRPLMQG